MIAIGRGMLYNPRWAWHALKFSKKECAYPPQYARAHHSLIGLQYQVIHNQSKN